MNASIADYAEHVTEADLRLLSAVAPLAEGAQPPDGAPPALPGGANPSPAPRDRGTRAGQARAPHPPRQPH